MRELGAGSSSDVVAGYTFPQMFKTNQRGRSLSLQQSPKTDAIWATSHKENLNWKEKKNIPRDIHFLLAVVRFFLSAFHVMRSPIKLTPGESILLW